MYLSENGVTPHAEAVCGIRSNSAVVSTATVLQYTRKPANTLSRDHSPLPPTRPWGFTSLPEHSERLCGLRSDDSCEAIAHFQGGVWGWDNFIAVPMYGDEDTPGRQP